MHTDFEKAYKSLNEEQKSAVDTIEGPIMVVAGPGTGKTQLLSVRVANILQNTQSMPSNILCLTFTESGAAAMRKRLRSIIGPDSYAVNIHTFHSFCTDIITRYPERFDFVRELAPISDIETVDLYRSLIDSCDLKECKPIGNKYFYLSPFQTMIKNLKREGIKPADLSLFINRQLEDFRNTPESEMINKRTGKPKLKYTDQMNAIKKNEDLLSIYAKYEDRLRTMGRYDFDDMILFVLEKFDEDINFLANFQEQLQYILVDEFQDTNGAQNRLLQCLTRGIEKPNIMVVGDDDQAIYRFQGASLENILQFNCQFSDYQTVIMKDNYRSTQPILDVAKLLIENNNNRLTQKLKLDKNLRANIAYTKSAINEVNADFGESELRFVAKEIKRLNSEEHIPLDDMAILFRKNADAGPIIEELNRSGIPYSLASENNILSDPYVNQLINVLRIVDDFNDPNFDETFFKFLCADFLEINCLDVYTLSRRAYDSKKGIFAYLTENLQKNSDLINGEKIARIKDLVLNWHKGKNNLSLPQIVEKILKDSGLIDYLLAERSRWEVFLKIKLFFKYVQELCRSSAKYELHDLLYFIDLQREHNLPINLSLSMPETSSVQLMTAHKSKGLEFDTVFIVNCIDSKWGNNREKKYFRLLEGLSSKILLEDADKNEDERRLFYVAVTRAKKRLYISYADKYLIYGSSRSVVPSQFVSEMEGHHVKKIKYKESEIEYEEAARAYIGSVDLPSGRLESKAQSYLMSLVERLVLSPTALNKYLLCPRKFMYDNLLRVPKTKSRSLALGTAIHYALEKLFLEFKKSKLLSLNELLAIYKRRLIRESLSAIDFELVLKEGGKMLTEYYQINKNNFKKPLFAEYNFSAHNVHYLGVPITGKVDKIELLHESGDEIRIIDYKTGHARSQNYLMGKTKENYLDYKRQAYFYALLAEADSFFRFHVADMVFEFVKDNKSVSMPFIGEEFRSFKEELVDAHSRINKGDFSKADQTTTCQTCGPDRKKCEYFDLCWSTKKAP